VSGTPRDHLDRVQRRRFVDRRRRGPEHPDARRVDEEAIALRRKSGERLDRGEVELLRARTVLGRGVHGAVGRRGGIAPRRRLHQVAQHRRGAARLHARRPFAVAHQRVHLVPAAHERIEHRRTHVTRSTGQEHTHVVIHFRA